MIISSRFFNAMLFNNRINCSLTIIIKTLQESQQIYPYKYNFYNPENINNATPNVTLTINGIVESIPKVIYIKRNFNYLTFRVITSNKLINVTIFNRAFMKNNLTVGKEICLIGKYDPEKNKFTASNILLKPILSSIIEPVYHQSNTLKNTQINKMITTILSKETIPNTLPNYISEKYNFISEYNALKEIHNPTNLTKLKTSKLVLTYKELFEFMFKINYLKQKRKENESNIIKTR